MLSGFLPASLEMRSPRMVSLHIDVEVPGVIEVPSPDVGLRIALVLPEKIPGSQNTKGHVRDTVLGDVAAVDGIDERLPEVGRV